jgi:Transcriptional regulator
LAPRKISKPKAKFHKSTFEKISEDRRQKIFDAAVSEFALNGYNATNINTIAKKAGISIGAMYSYFASKEDLFLSIIDKGFQLIETALREIDVEKGDIFDIFEHLFRIARDYAINYPELNQIYVDLTTQGLAKLADRLSHKLEDITAQFYAGIIKKAKQNGAMNPVLDDRMIAFYFDNLVMMFQFSFSSNYYRERMKIFLGDEMFDNEERIIQGLMELVKRALSQ